MNIYRVVLVRLFALCGSGCILAVTPVVALENSAPRPHLVVPKAAAPPLMTAAPDDPAWANAAVIPALTPMLSDDPALQYPVPPTEVRVVWDATYLYIRFTCTGEDIFAPYTEPDADLYKADVVEVFLDPMGDARQWVELEVSPTNNILDILHLCTAPVIKTRADLIMDWDLVNTDLWDQRGWPMEHLKTATSSIVIQGKCRWIVDIAWPAAALLKRQGSTNFSPMELHANFLRYDYQKREGKTERVFVPANWSPTMLGCPHISPKAMGVLQLAPPMLSKDK
jgi:hypothetical protein